MSEQLVRKIIAFKRTQTTPKKNAKPSITMTIVNFSSFFKEKKSMRRRLSMRENSTHNRLIISFAQSHPSLVNEKGRMWNTSSSGRRRMRYTHIVGDEKKRRKSIKNHLQYVMCVYTNARDVQSCWYEFFYDYSLKLKKKLSNNSVKVILQNYCLVKRERYM